MFRALTVVEDDAVTKRIQELSKRYARVEDLFFALKWRLARDPSSGVGFFESTFHVVKTDSLPKYIEDVPVIRVLYSRSKTQIVIYAIDIVEEPAGDVD